VKVKLSFGPKKPPLLARQKAAFRRSTWFSRPSLISAGGARGDESNSFASLIFKMALTSGGEAEVRCFDYAAGFRLEWEIKNWKRIRLLRCGYAAGCEAGLCPAGKLRN
jgi:hypothetical protein